MFSLILSGISVLYRASRDLECILFRQRPVEHCDELYNSLVLGKLYFPALAHLRDAPIDFKAIFQIK